MPISKNSKNIGEIILNNISNVYQTARFMLS